MKIIINGTTQEMPADTTIAALLTTLGYADRRVAVEVNREIIPRGHHSERTLLDGDIIELVQAMGGG